MDNTMINIKHINNDIQFLFFRDWNSGNDFFELIISSIKLDFPE